MMMAPKQKAEELVRKFKPFVQFKMGVDQSYVLKMAKYCALVAVDEIITNMEPLSSMDAIMIGIKYWNLVKLEIEKA